jgi:hypothetical protein
MNDSVNAGDLLDTLHRLLGNGLSQHRSTMEKPCSGASGVDPRASENNSIINVPCNNARYSDCADETNIQIGRTDLRRWILNHLVHQGLRARLDNMRKLL